VDSDPLKLTSSEDHISAAKKRCALKFSEVLENDQGLLAHMHHIGNRPLTIFTMKSKIGLKFSVLAMGEGNGNWNFHVLSLPGAKVSAPKRK